MGAWASDKQVIWRALCEAYENVESMIDARTPDSWVNIDTETKELIDADKDYLKALNRVAQRYYGVTVKGARDEPFKDAKLVSILTLLRDRR